MALNLRLRPEEEEALRAEAARSGRSQQELSAKVGPVPRDQFARTRARVGARSYAEVFDTVRQAMLGIAEQPLDFEVMNLSRRLEPDSSRSPDAIHLAAAISVDADLLFAYDRRLLDASIAHGAGSPS